MGFVGRIGGGVGVSVGFVFIEVMVGFVWAFFFSFIRLF